MEISEIKAQLKLITPIFEEVADPKLSAAIKILLNLFEIIMDKYDQQVEINQQLKDEINRLKGEHPRPKPKPDNKGKDHSSEKERKERQSKKTKKKCPLQIHGKWIIFNHESVWFNCIKMKKISEKTWQGFSANFVNSVVTFSNRNASVVSAF